MYNYSYPQTFNNCIIVSHLFHYCNQHNPRHSLPAANPNYLNPPCNTLYVGNLPPDTSEEEADVPCASELPRVLGGGSEVTAWTPSSYESQLVPSKLSSSEGW